MQVVGTYLLDADDVETNKIAKTNGFYDDK
jgi:hypothetical protein